MGHTSKQRQHVVIAGGSGFVGSHLARHLRQQGYRVSVLVRGEPKSDDEFSWRPEAGEIDAELIERADAVVNLAGATIAGGWWTETRKQVILKSRIDSTSTLAEAIASASNPPRVFVSTSAVGFYGSRPNEVLTEESRIGAGFLARVCREWESAADPAREAGVRVVHPRFGLVLSGEGGMLPLISKPFRLGLGGRIGGAQYMAWIDLHDLVRILQFCIENGQLSGPVNAVAPHAITNTDFTEALGAVLNRATVMPVPVRLIRKLGGGLVDELLLASQHVEPTVLEQAGFTWDRPFIKTSLKAAFGKS